MSSKQFSAAAQRPMSTRDFAKQKRSARRKVLIFVYAAVFGISALVLTPLSARQLRLKQHKAALVSSQDEEVLTSLTRLTRGADQTSSLNSSDPSQSPEASTQRACNPSSVEEFPKALLSPDQRHNGGFLLHFLVAIYMFVAVAIVCDDFFVPSLELLCDKLKMSEDVAGATFMSAGSSAPEFFTSVIGVFVSKSDVGVSTIVGSAVFNILCIIGVCALFAGRETQLTWWPLFRDSSYYLISVVTLIVVAYDERVEWWESVTLVVLYLFYILLMVFNRNIHESISSKFSSIFKSSPSKDHQTVHGIALQKVDFGPPGYAVSSAGAIQDYVISSNDKDILQPKDFADASLRIMLSKNFKPACRMRAAARIIIAARKREAQIMLVTDKTISSLSQNNNYQITIDRKEDEITKDPLPQDEDKETSDEEEGLCSLPSSCVGLLKWLALLPINLMFFITIPDCRNSGWKKWYMATFVNSIIWTSVLSYVMVWMTALIGDALNIPDTVMGVTFLAAGTSIPDCIASLLVARQGLGDMAVSNSIGSNVFDILVGLGFPWFLKTVVVDWNYQLKIRSRGLKYSVALLFVSVAVTITAIAANRWKLDRKLGLIFLLTYLVYVAIACLIELNVFAQINLPTCSS